MPNLNEKGLVYFIQYGDYYYNEYNNISSRSISAPFLSQKDAEVFATNAVSDLIWIIWVWFGKYQSKLFVE